jgi:hypothetical protein
MKFHANGMVWSTNKCRQFTIVKITYENVETINCFHPIVWEVLSECANIAEILVSSET